MTGSTRMGLRLVALAVVAVTSAGCGARARFSVLRPAMINAREFGGTITVARFEGHHAAAAAVQQDLRQRVLTAEGSPFALVEGGGGLVVHGVVQSYSYSERMEQSQGTCYRTVTNSEGQSRRVSYPCTQYTRIGTATVTISFNVTVSASGQTLFANTYTDTDTARRTNSGSHPANINGNAMLERIRAGLTADFARVILPWREIVRVTLGRCGAARSMCEGGIAAIRDGNFPAAIESFQRAIQHLEAQPDHDPGDLAEAYWNLGLAREYSGDYDGAVEAILRAIELDPDAAAYREELGNVQRMAEDAARLSEQGVTAP